MRRPLLLAILLLAAPADAGVATCPFAAGALPADTLPAAAPHGAQIPLDTIVVLMQENRSFDHYFGRLHFQGKRRSEGEPRNSRNPEPGGGPPVRAFHQTRYCEVADLDHGRFFDHVPPPPACVPDAIPPTLEAGDEPGAFDRYGIRVPVVVVSPYARRRFVSHTTHDHTSILRFIETRFDLPALTARDANADPMLEFFDFRRPRFRKPPRLPKATIDAARLQECAGGSTPPPGRVILRAAGG